MNNQVDKIKTETGSSTDEKRSLSPFDDLRTHIQNLEKRFENIFGSHAIKAPSFEWPEWTGLDTLRSEIPKVDILDKDNHILVRAEVPGMSKEEISLSLSDTTLTIKGEHKEESEKKEKENYYHRESSSKSFCRTLQLPCEVESTDAKANFKDGVLEINIPKSEKAKSQSIEID